MESYLRVAVASGNGTTVVFLEGLLILSNVYETVKIFEIFKSRKHRGNEMTLWSKKVFLSYKYPR